MSNNNRSDHLTDAHNSAVRGEAVGTFQPSASKIWFYREPLTNPLLWLVGALLPGLLALSLFAP